ncbi:MAG: electron transport complex subunit RsxC, partial [Desulfomonilia bacterium]
MAHTFKGGVHPVYSKEHTSASPILEPRPPKEVVLPMKQHLGAELTPLVKPGDYVLMGQKVADSDAFISAPVHASVSGYVRAVEPRLHPAGGYVQSVIIENDYKDAGFKGPPRREDEVDNLSPDDIV